MQFGINKFFRKVSVKCSYLVLHIESEFRGKDCFPTNLYLAVAAPFYRGSASEGELSTSDTWQPPHEAILPRHVVAWASSLRLRSHVWGTSIRSGRPMTCLTYMISDIDTTQDAFRQ